MTSNFFNDAFKGLAGAMVSTLGGETVVYSRGSASLSLSAIVEPITSETKQVSSAMIDNADVIFHVEAASLILSDAQAFPHRGDKIAYGGIDYMVITHIDDGAFFAISASSSYAGGKR